MLTKIFSEKLTLLDLAQMKKQVKDELSLMGRTEKKQKRKI